MERRCQRLAQERGAPFEEVYREEVRACETRLAGYGVDGSPADVLLWLRQHPRAV
jgi:hypothetical protein